MVKYTITLKLKSSDEMHDYSLNLEQAQEDHPEKIFDSVQREYLRQALQQKSTCKIDDLNLNYIIKSWIQDIREGYKSSVVTLDLTSLIESKIEQLRESGNQSFPPFLPPDLSDITPSLGALPPLNFTH
jgi:hypothetical protein